MNTLPQIGQVTWIGIRPQKRGSIAVVEEIDIKTATGITGDHYSKAEGNRQVTLIQSEHLDTVASILQKPTIDPALLRRNIVIEGINLLALKDKQFKIGEAILETTGLCHPCSRMETNLGEGGYNAMRGHGGITAKVIKSGIVKLGDKVQAIPRTSDLLKKD